MARLAAKTFIGLYGKRCPKYDIRFLCSWPPGYLNALSDQKCTMVAQGKARESAIISWTDCAVVFREFYYSRCSRPKKKLRVIASLQVWKNLLVMFYRFSGLDWRMTACYAVFVGWATFIDWSMQQTNASARIPPCSRARKNPNRNSIRRGACRAKVSSHKPIRFFFPEPRYIRHNLYYRSQLGYDQFSL